MSWGKSAWGSSPWGTGVSAPPPSLISSTPAIVERRGGTIITILGTDFTTPATVEVLVGGTTVVGTCYIFDPDFDLTSNRLIVGTPALSDGLYDLRVTTSGGPSAVLENALDVRLHAEQFKVESVRRKWAPAWEAGVRVLGA